MIKNNDAQLYSPTIAKVVSWGFGRSAFIPQDSTGLVDSNGDLFCTFNTESVLYDRAHRGKSWFILDLRTT